MLAEKADEDASDVGGSKKGSMLKKTFKAFGKVKPKFKGKKDKKQQMELFDSCASFDIDMTQGGLVKEGDLEEIDEEHEAADEETSEADAEEDVEQEVEETADYDKSSGSSKTSVSKGSEAEEEPDEGPPVIPTRQRRTHHHEKPGSESSRSSLVKEPSSTQVAPPSPACAAENSQKPSSIDRSNSSDSTRKSASHRTKKSEKKTGSSRPQRPKSTSSRHKRTGDTSLSPNTEKPKLKLEDSTASTSEPEPVESNPTPPSSPGAKHETEPSEGRTSKAEADEEKDTDERLKRLSVAYGESKAMDSYFAKLQDRKQNDGAEGTPEHPGLEGATAQNPGDQPKESPGSSKTPKGMKRLLKMGSRSSSKSPKESSKVKVDKEIAAAAKSKDEAAKWMAELATMLTPALNDTREEKPMKGNLSRTFLSASNRSTKEVDDDEESAMTQEFPEIPTAKRISLSDIRRSVVEPNQENADSEKSARQRSPRHAHHQQSASAHGDNESTANQSTSVNPLPDDGVSSSSSQRRRRSHRPAEVQSGLPEVVRSHPDERPEKPSLHPEDVELVSPRRHKPRIAKSNELRTPTESSEHDSRDKGADDHGSDKHSSHSRRHRGGSRRSEFSDMRSKSVSGAIPEGDVLETQTKGELMHPPGPPSSTPNRHDMRRRQSSRRTQKPSSERNMVSESGVNHPDPKMNKSEGELSYFHQTRVRGQSNSASESASASDDDDINNDSDDTPFSTRRSRNTTTRRPRGSDRSQRGSERSLRGSDRSLRSSDRFVRIQSTRVAGEANDLHRETEPAPPEQARKPDPGGQKPDPGGFSLSSCDINIQSSGTNENAGERVEKDGLMDPPGLVNDPPGFVSGEHIVSSSVADDDSESRRKTTRQDGHNRRSSRPSGEKKDHYRETQREKKSRPRLPSGDSLEKQTRELGDDKQENPDVSVDEEKEQRLAERQEKTGTTNSEDDAGRNDTKVADAAPHGKGRDYEWRRKPTKGDGNTETSSRTSTEKKDSNKDTKRGPNVANTKKVKDSPISSRKTRPPKVPGRAPSQEQKDIGGKQRLLSVIQEDEKDSSGKNIPEKCTLSTINGIGPGTKTDSKNISLAEAFEKGGKLKPRLFDDGQYSVSTDGGSEMFVNGEMSYSCIKTSDSVSAPQLVFNEQRTSDSLEVKNV